MYFETSDLLLLGASAILLLLAVISFQVARIKIALLLLFCGSLVLGYFMASLDPFLNLWDEQYHAVVAKHMVRLPLKPVLYAQPLFDFDYTIWTGNHIWLHKQPLFLWQIAGSLAVFGEHEIAVRLPSVILHALGSLLIFRIGKLAHNSQTGFYGALFFTVAYYPLELIAGRFPTDHNDLSFLIYTLGSFWAWFEYQNSRKAHWLIVIGALAGAAVLVKWLVGLLVFACWGMAILFEKSPWWQRFNSLGPLFASAVVAVIVFLPWQVYIHLNFPDEARFESQLNTAHFFSAIEGHAGDAFFHVDAIRKIYGSGAALPYILLLGLIIFIRRMESRVHRVAVISAVAITYVFFSLAATKMISFTLIAAPFIFLGLGAMVGAFLDFIPQNKQSLGKVLSPILLLVVCFFLLNPSKIQKAHTFAVPHDNRNRIAELAQMDFIWQIEKELGKEGYVIFNAARRLNGHIAVMFYTDHIAYDMVPNQEMIERVRSKGYSIAIGYDENLPDYINADPSIIKLK